MIREKEYFFINFHVKHRTFEIYIFFYADNKIKANKAN